MKKWIKGILDQAKSWQHEDKVCRGLQFSLIAELLDVVYYRSKDWVMREICVFREHKWELDYVDVENGSEDRHCSRCGVTWTARF